MPNATRRDTPAADVDAICPAAVAWTHQKAGRATSRKEVAWLVDDFRQDVCSSAANAARCGSRDGGRTCCSRTAASTQLRRWVVLGTVAELPKKGDAQTRLDEHLRPINQGTGRPESFIAFGTFVESQWKTLVLPTFKRSTQHGYKTVLNMHILPRGATGGCVTSNGWPFSSGSRGSSVSSPAGKQCGTPGFCSRAFSKRRSSTGYLSMNPARGVKFPQKALTEKPAIIAGDSFAKLLKQVDEPYRTMVSSSPRRDCESASCWA